MRADYFLACLLKLRNPPYYLIQQHVCVYLYITHLDVSGNVHFGAIQQLLDSNSFIWIVILVTGFLKTFCLSLWSCILLSDVNIRTNIQRRGIKAAGICSYCSSWYILRFLVKELSRQIVINIFLVFDTFKCFKNNKGRFENVRSTQWQVI